MDKRLLLTVVATLLAAPLSIAHGPAGTPKNGCEDAGEWLVHEYAVAGGNIVVVWPTGAGREELQSAGGNIVVVWPTFDGNVAGDCDPGFAIGEPCYTLDPNDALGSSVGVCGFNPPLADWDGHNEFSFTGATLLVRSGDGKPSADPTVGAGTLYCFGAEGHHAHFATVVVDDVVLGGGAEVTLAADTVDLTGTGEGCGDMFSDASMTGTGSVTATFPHGLDGSYEVYVHGTAGHVSTN